MSHLLHKQSNNNQYGYELLYMVINYDVRSPPIFMFFNFNMFALLMFANSSSVSNSALFQDLAFL